MAILTIGADDAPPPLRTPAILLIDPKTAANVVNVHRLAACFGIPQVWCTGSRVGQGRGLSRRSRLPPEERMRGFGKVDLIWCDRAAELFVAAAVPLVAIELSPTAESLLHFDHRADDDDDLVYVFGPEDRSVPAELLARCATTVQIPSFHCLNLANAAAAVLWDRTTKLHHLRGARPPRLRPDNQDVGDES